MSASPGKKRLVILDRDGVINRDSPDFVKSADEWIPLDGSIAAIASLSQAGFAVAVASNQSGLARGLFDHEALRRMHRKLVDLVVAEGGKVALIVICPHGPDDGCDCRKPAPGLLLQVADSLDVALDNVPVIGDSLRDLEAAIAVGAKPVLVRTGNGATTENALPDDLKDIPVFDDLSEAAAALVDGR